MLSESFHIVSDLPFYFVEYVQLFTTMTFLENGKEPRRLDKWEPHKHLRFATMTGFSADQSGLELTLHILENSIALECLTLDPRLGTCVWRYSTDTTSTDGLIPTPSNMLGSAPLITAYTRSSQLPNTPPSTQCR